MNREQGTAGQARFGRRATRVVALAALGCAVLPATTVSLRGDVPEKVYTYSVNHPTHGNIGTYRNRIVDDGAQISVRNEIRVEVKVLLVVAHQESSDTHEVWKKGRLISFSGVTQENGKKTTVTGEAEGAKFLVESAAGRKEAPADVYPNNPWSKKILNAKVLLGTKSGKLYHVHTGPGEAREIQVGGKTVQTEYFRVDGDATYELWFDKRGIAVRFSETDQNGRITFNLVAEAVQPASSAAAAPATKG
jgi:hypothetical protein